MSEAIDIPGATDPGLITPLHYQVLLGERKSLLVSHRLGILGQSVKDNDRIVALDLNSPQCITLFGEPGAGKSYAMGVILEMACAAIKNISLVPEGNELSVVVLHYSATQNYKPEFAASAFPNDNIQDLRKLAEQYKSGPARVKRVVLLAPEAMLPTRIEEFPGIECCPLVFSPKELQGTHWQILMGALGEADTPYLQVMNQILATHRDGATIDKIRTDVEASRLSPEDKDRAAIRLKLAEAYIRDDATPIATYVKPGTLVLVDLRDEYIKRKDALALFYVINQLVADSKDYNGKIFHKMCVWDEFHKLAKDPTSPVVESVIESIREMRHKSCSVLIASQDPPSVPLEAIEMSSLTVMLRMSSPRWLAHVATVKTPYGSITPFDMMSLKQGECYLWSKTASDPAYTTSAMRVQLRPRATMHGGDTKGMVGAPAAAPVAASAPA